MVYSLAFDALLLLILAMLIPIGMYRGGIREVCTTAGLLLGIQISQLWSNRWGEWLGDLTSMNEGVARFIMAIATIVLVTGVIGYGAGAAFSVNPSPGSRVYGGLIALANGLVFLGAMIQFVIVYLYDGEKPDIIADGYVARALSGGFDRLLLVISVVALLAIVFGMIVRERDPGESFPDLQHSPVTSMRNQPASTSSMTPVASTKVPEPSARDLEQVGEEVTKPAAGVKVKQVRHWEEVTPTTAEEIEKGWSRTWPSTVTSTQPTQKDRRRTAPPASYPVRRPSRPKDEDVLREWLEEENTPPSARPSRSRPDFDE